MPITEELVRQLWSELETVLEDPTAIVRLKELTLDPTVAAKMELEKIEKGMKAKYGDRAKVDNWNGFLDPGFLFTVGVISMGYGVLTSDGKGDLISVRSGGARDGGVTDIGIPETNILAHLKGLGVEPKDIPTIARYGNLYRLYRGTLKGLMDEVNDSLDKLSRCILPQLLERGLEEFDPSPQYGEGSRNLTYEILNQAKYRRGQREEHMGRFTKTEIKRLQNFVSMAQSSNYINSGNLKAEDIQLLEYFTDIGLFNKKNGGYEANWLDMSTASVLVYNRLQLRPDEVSSLTDIQKLGAH